MPSPLRHSFDLGDRPLLRGILETCLYASDLDAAERFYAGVLGLELFSRERGRHVFFRCGDAMFLVFDPGVTSTTSGQVGGVRVPPHGAQGVGHVAFRVREDELPQWRERLETAGVSIEAEIVWPRGGRSIYVRDPYGNSVELATPTIWGLAESNQE
jgi:catechol 2,3-dioxygenase-like lactoylglutathione lyase family enzyme